MRSRTGCGEVKPAPANDRVWAWIARHGMNFPAWRIGEDTVHAVEEVDAAVTLIMTGLARPVTTSRAANKVAVP